MAYSIYQYARTLLEQEKVRLVGITDRAYHFETYSYSLEDWVPQFYDRRTCRFRPCGSRHGTKNPNASWIPELSGYDCRHTLACKMLMDKKNIPYKNASDDVMIRRRDVMRLLVTGFKKNKVAKGLNEGTTHHEEKEMLAKADEEQGRWYVQEARFKTGGRADHLTLDTATVTEVLVSETFDQAAKKLSFYPHQLTIVFRKDGKDYVVRKGTMKVNQ